MKTFREFINEAKIKDKFELSDEDVSKIKRVMTAMDEPMSPAIASSLKRDVAKLQKQYGLTFKEMHKLVNEAKDRKITDYDEWESAVKKIEPKAKITKEGHGGSEMLIASVPGSPQMVGKWFGNYGLIYKGTK